MNKEHYDLVSKFTSQTPEQRIEVLINKLIDGLYCPTEGDITEVIDYGRLEKFKINPSEPINWGSLNCSEVNYKDGIYEAVIYDAEPLACPTLCNYVERFMKSWGWDVRVLTEC